MRLTLVANPTSGRGRVARVVPDAVAALESAGIRVDVNWTRDGQHLREVIRRERDSGADRVIVCGGDGSLHLAVQELVGASTALALIPAGTGDDNARTLGIPLKDVRSAALHAATGSVTTMDLGRVVAADGTERTFLGVLSSGFDSLVNERANTMRWPSGNARYAVAILGELRTFRPVSYRAMLDGREVAGEAMLVAVGNGASYGGGMRVCPDADPSDGLLDITWLHGVRTSTFLRVFPKVFSGQHVRTRHVSSLRAAAVRLEATGQVAYADGERVGPLPVDVTALPGALRVVRGGQAA
jgi:diacylglycerol kinase (ATP)